MLHTFRYQSFCLVQKDRQMKSVLWSQDDKATPVPGASRFPKKSGAKKTEAIRRVLAFRIQCLERCQFELVPQIFLLCNNFHT